MKTVIVNADDLGLSEGTNAAIMDLVASRAITSASLMANAPAFNDAVSRIRASGRVLPVGLHANFTQFQPVGTGEGLQALLDDRGRFRGRRALVLAWVSGKLRAEALETELRAQLAMLRNHGIRPTHVDSHQHAHLVWPLAEAMYRVAAERDLPVRRLRPWTGLARTGRKAKGAFLEALSSRRHAGAARSNDWLVSVFDADGVPSTGTYRRLLDSCPGPVIELMVHPADVDKTHRDATAISDVSAADLAVLRSPLWKAFQRDSGHRFVAWSGLKGLS